MGGEEVRGEVKTSRKINNAKKSKYGKIDDFWEKWIRETSYNFYKNKTASTFDTLYEKIKDMSAGANTEFPYERTILYHAPKMLCFNYQIADYWTFLM